MANRKKIGGKESRRFLLCQERKEPFFGKTRSVFHNFHNFAFHKSFRLLKYKKIEDTSYK